MAWDQGDVFDCSACACELTLTKAPASGKSATLQPTCCSCGQPMKKK